MQTRWSEGCGKTLVRICKDRLRCGPNAWQTTGVELHRLPVSAGDYIARHGQRAVSAEVRRWVAHPASVRHCGEPLGGLVPVAVTDRGPKLYSLKQCKNRFVDPYCSGWFRAELAERVGRVLAQHLDGGGSAILLVNTLSHSRADALGDVMGWHSKAWDRAKAGRRAGEWRGLRWFKAWDIVVGGWRGPHPHSNSIVLGPSGFFDSADWLGRHSAAWASSVFAAMYKSGRFGFPTKANRARALEAWEDTRVNMHEDGRGVNAVQIGADNVDLLARYACKSIAGAPVEVVDDRHRRPTTKLSGFTLLELACMAHDGQEAAGKLLAGSAVDLAGRRSWSASRSWVWVDEALEDDAEAEAVVSDGFVIGLLASKRYRAQRQQVDAFLDQHSGLDMEQAVTEWRRVDEALDLGITWFSEPVHVSDWADA